MMANFVKRIALACFAVLLCIGLAGCGDNPPTTYAVKVYINGQNIVAFDASSYTSGDNNLHATLASGRKNIVSGTYSVRRTDPGAANNTARATKYVAQLYSGTQVVETVNAFDYSSGNGKVYLSVSNTERVVFGGSFLLRNIGANVEGKSDGAKFKVTLYSDGLAVGTWNADSYQTSNGNIILKVNGIDSAIILGGDYVIEQFR